jgi:hypothetical protein
MKEICSNFFFVLKSLFPNDTSIMDEPYYFKKCVTFSYLEFVTLTHDLGITFGEKF